MPIESRSTYKGQLQFSSKSETIQQLFLAIEQLSLDARSVDVLSQLIR
jgi:hypothetical protein